MFVTLSASIALADDFKTINGKEYKGGSVSRVETDGIVLDGKSGLLRFISPNYPKRSLINGGQTQYSPPTPPPNRNGLRQRRLLNRKPRRPLSKNARKSKARLTPN